MKFKTLLKESGIFLGCFFMASGSTYGVIYANKGETTIIGNEDNDVPLTPAELMLNSIMNMDLFSIDADFEFMDTSDGSSGLLSVDGYADISDLEDLKISGDMTFKYGMSSINGTLGYFDETVYVDYNTSYLKMKTTDMEGVLDVLEGAGISVNLPMELTSLNLNTIADDLSAMEPEKITGGYMFTLPVSENIDIYFFADESEEYNFTGLETNKFSYGDVRATLKADVEKVVDGSVNLVNPELQGTHVYSDFKPAFNLVAGVTKFLKERSNTVNLSVDLDKNDETTSRDFIALNMDLSYNLDDNQYAIDAEIDETAYRKMNEYGEIVGSLEEDDPSLSGEIKEEKVDRVHKFKAYLYEDVLYLDHAENKLSFEIKNINAAVQYILTLIDEEALDGVLADLVSGMEDVDIMGMLGNLNDLNQWIKSIEVVEGEGDEPDKTAITFDLSIFGLDTPSFTLYANSELDEFLGIGIEKFAYKGYSASFYLGKKAYSMKVPEGDYVACDDAIGLVPSIYSMVQQKQFAVDLAGTVSEENAKDIVIGGGFQFDIEDDYGYGDITITDRDGYAHKVEADYSSVKTIVNNDDGTTSEKITDGTILVSYNDAMKAKMNNAEMEDLMGAVNDIVSTRDEHFYELFGDILTSLTSSPIYYVINNHEFGLLVENGLFSNISFSGTDEYGVMEFDFSGALVGLDCVMHISLSYDLSGIKSVSASNIAFGSSTIAFTADIGKFDESLNETRLTKADFVNAIELADLTALLKFGINTSQYDGYHFYSEKAASVNFSIIGIDAISLDIPLDIKVDNYKGDVSIAVEMSDVPIFDTLIFNLNGNPDYEETESRSASIYYKDGKVYMKRVDKTYDSEFKMPSWRPSTWYTQYTYYDVTYECVAETQYFFDNIMHYLVQFILGVENGTVLDAINGTGDSSSDYQIPYEKIVKDFEYDEDASKFNFDIDLAAIANNDDLTSFLVVAGVDQTKEELSYLDVKLNVGLVGVSIGVSANLPLVATYDNSYQEGGDCLDMSAMTSYIEAASGHTLNEEMKTEVVTSTNP